MGTTVTAASSPVRRTVLTRRVRLLVAATITYNLIEAVIALTAGVAASSTALIGFGLDSVIEVSSAVAVAWQFSGADPAARERRALRVIALSFFALAAYVAAGSVQSLLGGEHAQPSTVGIVLAVVSLAIMPGLSYAQRRAGRELGSASAVADSKQTLLCTYLSAVLLVGLVLNSLFGWSWADPAVALAIAALALREGLAAWRGDACCAKASPDATGPAGTEPAGTEPASTEPAGTGPAGTEPASTSPASTELAGVATCADDGRRPRSSTAIPYHECCSHPGNPATITLRGGRERRT